MALVHPAQGQLCPVREMLPSLRRSMPQIGSNSAPAHMNLTGTSALLRFTAHTQAKIRFKNQLGEKCGLIILAKQAVT